MLSALISDSYLRREGLDGPEFYVLALLSGSGAMIMAAANDLIVVFLGLEILSIALYVMAAYHRRRAESGEASMKYFILGAFSSAIFLYGVALCYGATGSTRLSEIAVFLAHTHVPKSIVLAGVVLLIVGLGFKVAAVPFHAWTPDVYQGSPTPATGFMAAVAKAGGFAALIRIMMGAFPTLSVDWRPVIWALAALTLLVGSILAIVQTDIKRMLAYSSISHAGYVLVGLQAANGAGTAGALFYLFSYSFMVLGSFAIVSVVSGKGEARNDVGGFRGLALRRPGLALAFTVLLLAQAGVPFTTGFFAKFYVVSAAVGQQQYVLAVLAMLAAAVATFFYLRVAIFMYSPLPTETAPVVAAPAGVAGAGTGAGGGSAASGSGGTAGVVVLGGLALADPPETTRIPIPATIYIALFFCVGFTVVFGVWPAPMIHFARHATLFF